VLLALFKVVPVPIAATWGLLDAAAVSTWPAYFGIAALIVGVSLVTRYREQINISEKERSTLTAINERLGLENVELAAKVSELAALPNLERHALLLENLLDSLTTHDQEMRSVSVHTAEAFTEIVSNLQEIRSYVIPGGREFRPDGR
jgi:hypothetical protein